MTMEIRVAALAVALLPALGMCAVEAALQTSEKQSITLNKLAQNQTRFTERLLDKITATAPKENVFISPLSISVALSMLREGAKGTSRTELNTALGSDALSSEEWSLVLPLLRSPNVTVSNGLWTSKKFQIRNEFIETLQQRFHTEVEGVNFENEDTAEHINKWITESTKGMIPGQLKPNDLRGQVLFLINAIAFEDTWRDQFEPENNEKGDFLTSDGQRISATYMTQFQNTPYAEFASYKTVSLGYKHYGYWMNLILPNKGVSPYAALKKAMSGAEKPMKSMTNGAVTIPKWQGRATYDMVKVLSGMGMNSIFEPGRANLSGVGSSPGDYFVSSIIHRTFVQVNESGTKAAATTEIMMGATSAPVETFEFKADRAFAYTISGPHGEVLFVGIMNNPAK